LAGYLPKEWNGKRVAVRFARGRGFDARLVGDNAGGITVEPVKEEDAEEEHARSAFVPWAAVRYIRRVPAIDPQDYTLAGASLFFA
jgi:hypothetical protein